MKKYFYYERVILTWKRDSVSDMKKYAKREKKSDMKKLKCFVWKRE